MEPEICMKILRNWSEKLGAKFPVTTRFYSRVKIARLNDAFSDFFELEASPVEGQSLQQKDNKRRKRRGEKKIFKKTEKPKDVGHFLVQKLSGNFDFCACPSKHVIKRNASGKKSMLSCSKCIFE